MKMKMKRQNWRGLHFGILGEYGWRGRERGRERGRGLLVLMILRLILVVFRLCTTIFGSREWNEGGMSGEEKVHFFIIIIIIPILFLFFSFLFFSFPLFFDIIK